MIRHAQRQSQFAQRMKLSTAQYAQRVEEDKTRAAAAARDRERGVKTVVSIEKAKMQAQQKGYSFPDYVDILSTAGIELKK